MCSCTTKKNIYGNYQYKGFSYGFYEKYDLEIKKDSFSLSYKSQDASPKCVGKWILLKDTLYLKCNTENSAINMISNGYMNKRDYQLKINNNKELLMLKENIILKK
jgi:hypothetical protein